MTKAQAEALEPGFEIRLKKGGNLFVVDAVRTDNLDGVVYIEGRIDRTRPATVIHTEVRLPR